MDAQTTLDDIAKRASDAAFDYKCLLLSQPNETLNMLARHVEQSPSRCVGVLGDLGDEFSKLLIDQPSQSARVAIEEIATRCACEDAEGMCLDELSAAFPALWKLSDHRRVFSSLADAINSTWEHSEGANLRAAERARSWVGAGLTSGAWLALSTEGGQAWRAFRDLHAQIAREAKSRKPDRIAVADLGWRAAKRLERAIGVTGYGEHGSWLHSVSPDPAVTSRMEAAAGLSSLIAEARAENAAPWAHPEAARYQTLLASALAAALNASQDKPHWDAFALRALDALLELNPEAGKSLVKVPMGFALFGSNPPQILRQFRLDQNTEAGSGIASLSDLMAMHPRSLWRARGFELGASAASAARAFEETVGATALGTLKFFHNQLRGDKMEAAKEGLQLVEAMVESWNLGLVADFASFTRGDLGRSAPAARAPRL